MKLRLWLGFIFIFLVGWSWTFRSEFKTLYKALKTSPPSTTWYDFNSNTCKNFSNLTLGFECQESGILATGSASIINLPNRTGAGFLTIDLTLGQKGGKAKVFENEKFLGTITGDNLSVKTEPSSRFNKVSIQVDKGTMVSRMAVSQFETVNLPNVPYVIFWLILFLVGLIIINLTNLSKSQIKLFNWTWIIILWLLSRSEVVATVLNNWTSLRGYMYYNYIFVSAGVTGVSIVIFLNKFKTAVPKKHLILFSNKLIILSWLNIFLIAFTSRWLALERVVNLPLDSDVGYYVTLAKTIVSPYSTGVREPLFVWWTKLMTMFGNEMLTARLGSIFWSVLLIGMAWYLFRKYLTVIENLALSLILAIHPFLIDTSVRGLREDMYTALIMMCTYFFVFRMPFNKDTSWKEVLAGGILGAVTLLIRFMSLPYLLLIWIFYIYKSSLSLRKIFVLIGIPVLLFYPYLRYNKQAFGKATFFSDFQAKFQRNYEFVRVKKIDCAGCPTLSELYTNGYAGGDVSTWEYFFKLHSVKEVVGRTAIGTFSIFGYDRQLFSTLIGSSSKILLAVTYTLGIIYSLFKKRWLLFVLPILMMNTILFLIPVGIDIRVAMHIIPFLIAIQIGSIRPIILFIKNGIDLITNKKFKLL